MGIQVLGAYGKKRFHSAGDDTVTVGKAVATWEKGRVSIDGTRKGTCNRGLV